MYQIKKFLLLAYLCGQMGAAKIQLYMCKICKYKRYKICGCKINNLIRENGTKFPFFFILHGLQHSFCLPNLFYLLTSYLALFSLSSFISLYLSKICFSMIAGYFKYSSTSQIPSNMLLFLSCNLIVKYQLSA